MLIIILIHLELFNYTEHLTWLLEGDIFTFFFEKKDTFCNIGQKLLAVMDLNGMFSHWLNCYSTCVPPLLIVPLCSIRTMFCYS